MERKDQTRAVQAAERIALAGFALYAMFAPHSIAGADSALVFVFLGWIARTVLTKRTGIKRTPLDIPILLFVTWTVLSSLLSAEPRISLLKLESLYIVLVFYAAQAIITRRTALWLVAVLILSGTVGALWSVFDVARGRGVLVESVSFESPFRAELFGAGDAVWRVGALRVNSVREIDGAIRSAPAGTRLSISVIARGEHAEREGFIVTDEMKTRASPSGLTGTKRTHLFRASGWTRHYETFSESLQILAQLALGLALANFHNREKVWRFRLALAAYALLSIGIALTAMRTVIVALAIGSAVIAWHAAQHRARLVVLAALVAVLAFGALVVWRTRATDALQLQDASSTLRLEVARVALKRIMLHPVFGHGMDAVKKHWTQWGFPGTVMIHTHSTPLQLAFDRGLPALLLWLWIVVLLWTIMTRAERLARDSLDANKHGLLLGAMGAIAGFFASSLVNYNLGDAEVALLFWWLAGVVITSGSGVMSLESRVKS